MATCLTLVRHGEPATAALGTHYGRADIELSETGRAQSIAVAGRLADARFDAVWSSGLQRAHWLAEHLASARGLRVHRETAFQERDVGRFQGMTYAEAARAFPVEAEQAHLQPGLHRPPDGENMDDLAARVLPAVRELIREHADAEVVLVAHAGPIRVLLGEVLGVATAQLERIRLDYCSVSCVRYAGDRTRLLQVNAMALQDTGSSQ